MDEKNNSHLCNNLPWRKKTLIFGCVVCLCEKVTLFFYFLNSWISQRTIVWFFPNLNPVALHKSENIFFLQVLTIFRHSWVSGTYSSEFVMLLDFHHLMTGCTLCLTLLGGDSWHCCQNGHQYMIFLSAKKIKKYKVDRRSMSKVLDVKEKKMVDKVTKTKFISMFQVFWSVVYLIWVLSITAGVNFSQSSGLSSLYTVVHACLVLDSFINQLFSFLLTLATYRCSFEVRVVGGGPNSPQKWWKEM